MAPPAADRQAGSEADMLLPPSPSASPASSRRRRQSSSSSTAAAATAAAYPRPVISTRRALAIVFSIWVLIFLQASNMSGMAMAQSAVAADLDAYEHAMWFTSVYLIASASFAPLVGRLASVFPSARLLAASALFFAVGAVLTATAPRLDVFLLGRVVVGLGGAGVMTLSLITVLQLADKHRRGLFIGLVNAGFTVGLSLGAVVYGALLPAVGWRMLFLVQAPIAVLAGVGVLFSMPHFAHDDGPGGANKGGADLTVWEKLVRIDYAGAAFLTLTIIFFLYGMSGTFRFLPILLSLVCLLLFIVTETWYVPLVAHRYGYTSGADPIVPLEVLRSRGVLLSCLAQLGVMAARWTVLYYAPIYVLAVRGFSAATSGSALIPTNLGFGTGGLVVGWLHVRRSGAFWLPSIVSLLLFAGSLSLVGQLSRAPSSAPSSTSSSSASDGLSGLGTYALALFANGFCTGAFLNYTLAHLLHLTRPSTHFIITSLLATFRGFSGSFGTAIGGGFFMGRLATHLSDGFARLDGGDGGNLSDARRALVTRLVGSPALVYGTDAQGHAMLTDAERAVAVASYESALGQLYRSAALVALVMLIAQAGTGWAAPKTLSLGGAGSAAESQNGNGILGGYADEEEDEEEILEAIEEHDTTMEA